MYYNRVYKIVLVLSRSVSRLLQIRALRPRTFPDLFALTRCVDDFILHLVNGDWLTNSGRFLQLIIDRDADVRLIARHALTFALL